MSVIRDCPSCEGGDHSRHDPDHGVIKGLIGGSVCGCKGDCKERAEERRQRFLDRLGVVEVPLVELCPDCETQGHYDGRVLIDGRGIYTCLNCGTKWQDASEKPNTKAARIVIPGVHRG